MIGATILALFAFSALLMVLWNALIPDIFGLTTINYWQALGLAVLSKMIFGGLPDRRSHDFNERRERFWGNSPAREKWMNMSAEEREEFIKRRKQAFRRNPFSRDDFKKDFEFDTTPDDSKDGGK